MGRGRCNAAARGLRAHRPRCPSSLPQEAEEAWPARGRRRSSLGGTFAPCRCAPGLAATSRGRGELVALLLLAGLAQLEAWWPGNVDGPRAVAAAGAAAMTLPLLWRRAAPLAVTAAVTGAPVAQAALGVEPEEPGQRPSWAS